MAPKLALFEFVNEDNALEIADSSRIIGFRKEQFSNEAWDFKTVCQVRWQGKNGRIDIFAAKVLRFGDERSELKRILERLLKGDDISEIIKTIGNLGRGHRSKRSAMCDPIESDDENVPQAHKRIKKTKAVNEKNAEKDILSILKERNQQKQADLQAAAGDQSGLKNEVAELRQAVKELHDINRSIVLQNEALVSSVTTLQESNRSIIQMHETLVTSVESLMGLPTAVQRLFDALKSGPELPVRHSRPSPPLSPCRLPPSPCRLPLSPCPPPSPSVSPSSDLSQPETTLDSTLYCPSGIYQSGCLNRDKGTSLKLTHKFSIPQSLISRINKSEPRKMTNDILHGLFSEEYLASHSVCGGKRASGLLTKPAMDPQEVSMITDVIKTVFPTRSKAEIHFYMREKLNNASKTFRRKQEKM